MNIDPNGNFFLSFLIGLGIAALIGAGVGAVVYTASEVISYALTGEWNWSWGMFAGSILGGSIGGALAFFGLGALGASFVTGFSSSILGMGLQNAWEETNYSFGQILLTSIVVGGISAAMTGLINHIRIPKLNSGRGSFEQISNQITTKFTNGAINRITGKTFAKMSTLVLYQTSFGAVSSGLFQAFGWNSDILSFWSIFLI